MEREMSTDPEVEAIGRIEAVKTVLRVLLQATGLRLALVARVTSESWTCCAVLDEMKFGLNVGDQLKVETTFCNSVRETNRPLFLPRMGDDPQFAGHIARSLYNVESYVAVPLMRRDGSPFGVLCALDSAPVAVKSETLEVFRHMADLIGFQLQYEDALGERDAQILSAKEAATLREQLIGIVSHDLRNPLNAIDLAAASLLRHSSLDQRALQMVGRITHASDRANRLIRDLLDFTQARMGKMLPINRQITDLHALVAETVDQMQSGAPNRSFSFDREGDGRGSWDPDRLVQVLTNLLGNALQYSPQETPIQIRVREGPEETIELSVTNQGPSIPEGVLNRIFEPMTRGTSVGTERRSVGLGLFIVERIAQAHGGAVEVRSSAEHGTCFTVRLPRSVSA